MCKAIIDDNYNAASRFVKLLHDVNFRDVESRSPLEIALTLDRHKMVELLLGRSVELNQEVHSTTMITFSFGEPKHGNDQNPLEIEDQSESFFYYSEKASLWLVMREKNVEIMQLLLDMVLRLMFSALILLR